MKSLIISILLFFVSFNSISGSNLIVGKWCESGPDVKNCEAFEMFYADGLVVAEGTVKSEDMSYTAKGTWKVDGNKLCFNFYFQRLTKISNGDEIKQGVPEYFCNELVLVSEKMMKFKSFVNGNIGTMHRIE